MNSGAIYAAVSFWCWILSIPIEIKVDAYNKLSSEHLSWSIAQKTFNKRVC